MSEENFKARDYVKCLDWMLSIRVKSLKFPPECRHSSWLHLNSRSNDGAKYVVEHSNSSLRPHKYLNISQHRLSDTALSYSSHYKWIICLQGLEQKAELFTASHELIHQKSHINNGKLFLWKLKLNELLSFSIR